jgi:hypothetical protein
LVFGLLGRGRVEDSVGLSPGGLGSSSFRMYGTKRFEDPVGFIPGGLGSSSFRMYGTKRFEDPRIVESWILRLGVCVGGGLGNLASWQVAN